MTHVSKNRYLKNQYKWKTYSNKNKNKYKNRLQLKF